VPASNGERSPPAAFAEQQAEGGPPRALHAEPGDAEKNQKKPLTISSCA